MNKEKEMIKLISMNMPRSKHQLNQVFESDSEILEVDGGKLLVNVDEFSQEDLMREHDPYTLGWNLAVGSISDILATGGVPVFFAHSLVVNKDWSRDYIQRFSNGVATCLRESGTSFIGGDFGNSPIWRYTATVIGKLQGEPMLRCGAKMGDSIYTTGKIGLGNFEAGLKLYAGKKGLGHFTNSIKSKFALRYKESRLIRKFSQCCIDSSDGVFNALNAISEMSHTGYTIESLPYIKSGLLLSKLLSIPKTLLFLGECGEYELIFTVGKGIEKDFLSEAKEQGFTFYKIGEVVDPSRKILKEDTRNIDLSTLNIRARDYEDSKVYLKELIRYLEV